MVIRFGLSICVSLLAVSVAMAQCTGENCGGEGVYSPVVTGGDCGSVKDWDEDYYDCCRKNIFDYEVCDPCCRKPYVSFFGGYSNLDNISRTDTAVSPAVFNIIDDGTTIIDPGPPPVFSNFLADTIDVQTVRNQGLIADDGFGFGGAIGYRVHPLFRVETEFSYRENDALAWFVEETTTTTTTRFTNSNFAGGNVIDQTVTRTRTEQAATGDIRSYSGMFNSIYDFSIPRMRCFNLYLGGGIGLSNVDGDIITPATTYRIDSTSFAYQVIAGVNFPLSERLKFFADYRYLGADNISIDDVTNNVSLGKSDGVDTQNIFVGVIIQPRR